MSPCLAQGPGGSETASKSWIFGRGDYTNSPKTGERVWQFAPPQPVYRDPNALWESPHGSYPFEPDVYDPYMLYGPHLYYGVMPYLRPDPYRIPAYMFPAPSGP